MGYDMEMDDFHDEEEFNRKELEKFGQRKLILILCLKLNCLNCARKVH